MVASLSHCEAPQLARFRAVARVYRVPPVKPGNREGARVFRRSLMRLFSTYRAVGATDNHLSYRTD
jgi:hypothetical protein